MQVDRWLAGVALLITTLRGAAAEPAPTAPSASLEGCDGLPAREQARYERVGDALHVVARSGQRYLVFPKREDRECAVYPIRTAAARTTGHFGTASHAFALLPPQCREGNCWVALAVRGDAPRPLAAVHSDADCDSSVELRPIKLFPGHDSLELVCHTQAAGGWQERLVLFDVVGENLVELFSLRTGDRSAASPAERKAGSCDAQPIGWLHVEKVADKPVLRVVDPESGELFDGRGILPARQLGFDPDQRAFVPTGAPDVPTKVDERAACRPH